ncbi:hypothetical protein MASR1M97_02360 [Candidatus Desulfobacillus denitrificans]
MSLLSFDDALQKLLAAARPLAEVEEVDTVAAAGRVLAHAQASGLAVPPLDNSAMDGYAVRLADVAAPGRACRWRSAFPPAASARRLPPAPRRASSPARRCRKGPKRW